MEWAIFSATMTVGMWVFPLGTVGMRDASPTRKPSTPATSTRNSTTSSSVTEPSLHHAKARTNKKAASAVNQNPNRSPPKTARG